MRRSDCSSRLLLQVIPPSFNSFKLFRVHFDFTRNTCWFCFTREQPVNHFFQQRQLIQRKPAKLAALRGGRKKSESRRGGREKEVFCAGSFGLKNSNLNVCNIIKTKKTVTIISSSILLISILFIAPTVQRRLFLRFLTHDLGRWSRLVKLIDDH